MGQFLDAVAVGVSAGPSPHPYDDDDYICFLSFNWMTDAHVAIPRQSINQTPVPTHIPLRPARVPGHQGRRLRGQGTLDQPGRQQEGREGERGRGGGMTKSNQSKCLVCFYVWRKAVVHP